MRIGEVLNLRGKRSEVKGKRSESAGTSPLTSGYEDNVSSREAEHSEAPCC
jgi:hypothetical protein